MNFSNFALQLKENTVINKILLLVLCLFSFNASAEWQLSGDGKGIIGDPVETSEQGVYLDPYVFIPDDYPTSLGFSLFYSPTNHTLDCTNTPDKLVTHLTNGKYIVYSFNCVSAGFILMPETTEGHDYIINELRTKDKVSIGSFIMTTHGFNDALNQLRIVI